MHVAHLALQDFRSYASAELPLDPGVSAFVGPNGQGKTNLVEAIGYIATQSSHRAATDAPLVRHGAPRAIVRAGVVRDDRQALIEIEVNPGRANRARLNRSPVPRPREILGILRTVLFAPEDLALVKGDPGERRRFLDELLTVRAPRFAGVRSDYDRVLKQRNALLRSAAAHRRAPGAEMLATLDVWDSHLARAGAELLGGRLELVAALRPLVAKAYDSLAPTGATELVYRSSVHGGGDGDGELSTDRGSLVAATEAALAESRRAELERGVSLVGPHRDELHLRLGDLPARGYASHGESWSLALSLRLAAFELLRAEGDDPVLILDDVFAELDTGRRSRLAELVAPAEQVLVTAAVPADVPSELSGAAYDVADGDVTRAR
ncbi:DNA replication/repair protein RecF [Actinomadura sp. HBU206391]|uniref:DNA replication/repair protein RecF n=1 Tax=Actinomadura sp. HBU206391 TaxID=2731692 RepID=UPI00164FDE9F|nr:DNA replication/repair protein RecF [Actinomadura sp. HBU206391]MBC6456493.1 DNA replication/repair protein RecF [Actinomadura sp. HBU206391]